MQQILELNWKIKIRDKHKYAGIWTQPNPVEGNIWAEDHGQGGRNETTLWQFDEIEGGGNQERNKRSQLVHYKVARQNQE